MFFMMKKDESIELRSKRSRKPKDFGSDFYVYLVEGSRDSIESETLCMYNIDKDPKTFKEAMQSHDASL